MAEKQVLPKPATTEPETIEDGEQSMTMTEVMQGMAELLNQGRAKLRPSSKMQQKPKATGERYGDFEMFLCRPETQSVPDPKNPTGIRVILTGINVTDRVGQCKIEPHLVYGKYENPYTKGYNDMFLLGQDGSGVIKIYFPVKFDANGKKIETFGANTGDKFKATTLKIFVKLNFQGQIKIQEREFNLFEYKGSKSLKEQVTEIKAVWEHKFVDNELIS